MATVVMCHDLQDIKNKPLGILFLTSDTEVSDSGKEV